MTPADARALLAHDEPAAARSAIAAAVDARIHERGDHLAWARVCEEAGLVGLAFRELLLAARDAPQDRDTLIALADAYLERGEGARAVPLLEQVLAARPADVDALRALVGLYRDDALTQRVAETVARASAAGLNEQVARELLHGEGADRDDLGAQPQEIGPIASDGDVARFLALFQGREDVHARQWHDPRTEGGYSPVHAPFTHQVARNHLLGNVTVGVYPIRLDGTVTFFAIDLDITKIAIEAARGKPEEARRLRRAAGGEALRLLGVLRELGFEPLLEDSGYKGRHLWVFLVRPEPAQVVHNLGRFLLASQTTILQDGLHLEFFPKQGRADGKGLGNLIKLPLGIHRRSGRPSVLLDDQGRPVADPFRRLHEAGRAERAVLHAAIDVLRERAPAVVPLEAEAAPPSAPDAPQTSAGPPPPAPPPAWTQADFDADPQVRHVLRHCPALAEIRRQVEEHRRLSHDEQLVLIHTLGHLAPGVLAVNYLLSRCVDVAPQTLLKSALAGHPMSCPKIRKRVPQITSRVDCACPFPFAPDRYPTPTLHLLTLHPEARVSVGPAPVEATAENAARRYALLLRKVAELDREVAGARQALLDLLRAAPDRMIACEGGRYVLGAADGVEEIVWEAGGLSAEQLALPSPGLGT